MTAAHPSGQPHLAPSARPGPDDGPAPSYLSLLPPSAAPAGADLSVGGCLVSEIARQFGTPAYVIDEAALRSRARDYLDAFTGRHPRTRICFAAKAYPSASIIRVLA